MADDDVLDHEGAGDDRAINHKSDGEPTTDPTEPLDGTTLPPNGLPHPISDDEENDATEDRRDDRRY